MCILSSLKGAPFWSNGIWFPYTFRSYDKKFQKSPINICLDVCILVLAPYVCIELHVGSSRRELQILVMGFGCLTHSGALTKNFRSLRSIFALLLAIYYLLPIYIYIELPVGSSRRELHFWAMGFGLLTHSGAMTKKSQKSTTNICFVACILVFAPYVYFELPLGSSWRRELHFLMGFGLLTYSGTMTKKCRKAG